MADIKLKKPDDIVLLWVFFHHNNTKVYMQREQASNIMRSWYHMSNDCFGDDSKCRSEALSFLRQSFAINEYFDKSKSEDTFCLLTFRWRDVICMSINEVDEEVNYKRYYKYMEKMTDILEKHTNDLSEGEQWKKQDEEDEEDEELE